MLIWEATRSSRLLWSRRWPDSGQYQSTWTVAWPAISPGTGFLPVGNRMLRFTATLLGAFPSLPCSSGSWHWILDWSAEQPAGLAPPGEEGSALRSHWARTGPAAVAALPGPGPSHSHSPLHCSVQRKAPYFQPIVWDICCYNLAVLAIYYSLWLKVRNVSSSSFSSFSCSSSLPFSSKT